MDLGFVAILILPRQAAKENAAVELLAVADAFELQQEVVELLFGLQIAGAILDIEPALRRDGEFRFGPFVVAVILFQPFRSTPLNNGSRRMGSKTNERISSSVPGGTVRRMGDQPSEPGS